MLDITELTRRPVFKFIAERSGPFDGEVELTRDRVYILPTRVGFIFALLLLILLIGSINYEKNLGFIMTFLLAGVGNILLLACWRNLAGLQLKRRLCRAVFCGEAAHFEVNLINRPLLDRHSIAISHSGREYDVVDCEAVGSQIIRFSVDTRQRGLLDPGKFRLYTEFPAGLFIAWTWIDLSMSCVVYPQPDRETQTLLTSYSDGGEDDIGNAGQDNFSHLRKYQQGDNISHVAWKTLAKSDELYSKQFIGATPAEHWIHWDEIPARDTEHRLSIITALILHAEGRSQHYGLRLPTQTIRPDNGSQHLHRCLTALALYE